MTIPNSLSYNFNYSVYPSGSVDQYYRHSGHKTSRLLTLKTKKCCKLTLRHPWICYFFAIKALKKIDKIQLENFKTGRLNAGHLDSPRMSLLTQCYASLVALLGQKSYKWPRVAWARVGLRGAPGEPEVRERIPTRQDSGMVDRRGASLR